jgi:nicotinamidase-related amidase
MSGDFEDHCWKDVITDDLREMYSDYRRETFVGKNPALIAIDLYNKVYFGGDVPVMEAHRKFPGSCGEHAWKAIPPTVRLFAAARRAGIPIVYTTGLPDRANKIRATKRDRAKDVTAANVDPLAIKEEFKPEPQDLIIYKERASGFYGTPLSAYLTQMGVNSVIMCGESTSGCLRASSVDAYSHGFHVTIAEECAYDRSLLSHKINLFDMHHKYADVMHTDDIVAHLDKLPAKAKA